MKLFEPLTVRNLTLNNRIVMAPMALRLEPYLPRNHAYFLERALGDVGTIIVQATPLDLFVDDNGWENPDGFAWFSDKMRAFTERIRKTGSAIGVQLWHWNQFPSAIRGESDRKGAYSAGPTETENQRALTVEEIKFLIRRYGQAADGVKQMGFSFVEIHGAHGYLLGQFFSGIFNQRTDEYGGDVRRRMQFGLEVTRNVRAAVGNDYPIFFRIGADEDYSNGVTIEQARLYAAALEKAGVDVMDVSIGANENKRLSPGKKAEMGTFAYLAEAIKRNIEIPVVAVGRINTSEIAESILTNNQADLVAIGRQLIADPYWPRKVRQGRENAIIACRSCNTCFTPLNNSEWKPGDQICKVNEWAGREIDRENTEGSKE